MPTVAKKKSLRSIDPVPMADYEQVVGKMSPKDRGNITRYLENPLTAASEGQVSLWKRFFCVMAALSPHAIQSTGQLAVQFYVADGKHRLQVFALEDARQGTLNLYIPDCTDAAMKQDLLGAPKQVEDVLVYPIIGTKGETLNVESLTAAGTINAPEFFKHMLGWNRKAIRVSLPATASAVAMHTAEILCVLGAQKRVAEATPAVKR